MSRPISRPISRSISRSISRAIVGVAAFVLFLLGLPLAVVVQRSIVSSEMVKLQATAAAALAEVSVPIDLAQLRTVATDADAPPPFAVYDAAGTRVFGPGTQLTEATAVRAMTKRRETTAIGERLVVATPIFDRAERLRGVISVTATRHEVDERTWSAWAVMAAGGLSALGVASVLARRLARQLAAPITRLAGEANELILGQVIEPALPTGISEIDELAAALRTSGTRVGSALARERQFSADVSHQLRTPIAGIRLKLESAAGITDTSALATSVLADLDRVEATMVQLLALARDATPGAVPTAVRPLLDLVLAQWRRPLAAAGRVISMRAPDHAGPNEMDMEPLTVMASPNGIGQILDVLIDNAAEHGRGAVTLVARPLSGGLAIDVSDEGSLDEATTEAQLFDRRDGDGHGIGLSLARSLADADGARLLLSNRRPTTFTLFLVAP